MTPKRQYLRWLNTTALAASLLLAAGLARPPHEAAASAGRIFLPIGVNGSPLEGNAVPIPPSPTAMPTAQPTALSTMVPTALPTALPTLAATATGLPSPTATPTTAPIVAPTPAADAGGCPKGNFLAVKADPHNTRYPDPVLKVSCTGTAIVVESNGIPSFEFRKKSPNELQAQAFKWQIPLTPTIATTETQIPLLGPVAIIVDGLPIYGPNEAPPQGTADPFLDGILDFCGGHTANRGDYHYHVLPGCLFQEAPRALVGRVVGYAFDGITILAPYVCQGEGCDEVKKLKSSWQKTSDARNAWDAHSYVAGSGDLDRCNGRVGPDGKYHYYATDTFPYLLACYKGVAARNGPPGGRPGPFLAPTQDFLCHVTKVGASQGR